MKKLSNTGWAGKKHCLKKACIDQNALSQPDCRIFKSTIFPEQIDETASFFACWHKLKVDRRFFGWAWSKTDGIDWFLHAGTYSRKLKVDGKFLGWASWKLDVASLVTGL